MNGPDTRAVVADVLATALDDERIHLPRRALDRLIGRVAELLDEADVTIGDHS